jgi:porin
MTRSHHPKPFASMPAASTAGPPRPNESVFQMLKLCALPVPVWVILAATTATPAVAQIGAAPSTPAAPATLAQTTPDPSTPTATTQQATAPAGDHGAGPSPYQLNLLYTGELWNNARGGIRQGTIYMYNVDGRLSVDTDRAFGWTGGRFVLEGFYQSGNSISNNYVNAADWQSPLDSGGVAMYRLYQAYYEQTIGSTDILFGIYDLETEFSATKPMNLFLSKNLTWNTALDEAGTAPLSGTIGPGNYPYTPLAFRIRETINDQWSVQAVVADGAADDPNQPAHNGVFFSSRYGALGIAEVDYKPVAYTKIMAGAWGMTSKLPTNNMTNPDGSPREIYGEHGFYFGGTTRLYSAQGRRGLDGFFTVGFSTPASTNVSQSLNAGLVYTGLFDGHSSDKMGISIAVNGNPASYRQAQIALGNGVDRYETNFEVTYRAKINSWLTVQPDIQYIIRPGYDPTVKNDLLIGLHFEIGHLL